MPKKKFKDTGLGKFLRGIGSKIGSIVDDVVPDKGILGVVKRLIVEDTELSKEDKEYALRLLEMDLEEMNNVTKRWESDMTSDSWLSKNTRPLTLIFLTFCLVALIVLDSFEFGFNVDDVWVDLLKNLLITVYIAYFGSRGVEKYKSINK